MINREKADSRFAVLIFTCTAMIWAQHAYGIQELMMESAVGKLTDLLTGVFGTLISLIALTTAVTMALSGRLAGATTAIGVMIAATIGPSILKSLVDQPTTLQPAKELAKQEAQSGDASGFSFVWISVGVIVALGLVAAIQYSRRANERTGYDDEALRAFENMEVEEDFEDEFASIQRTLRSLDVPPIEVLHQRREEGKSDTSSVENVPEGTESSKTTVSKNVRKVVL